MADIPMSVYILTHLVPTTKTVTWFDVMETPFDLEALGEARRFREWLSKEVGRYGQAFECGTRHTEVGVESRVIVCLHTAWPELSQQEGVTMRTARGEIVEVIDDILYAGHDALIVLQSEVLVELFLYDDGIEVPDLDVGINHRLTRWARQELDQLGYNRKTSDEVITVFLSGVRKNPPSDWIWDDLRFELNRTANNYCDELQRMAAKWYVFERLAVDDDDDDDEPTLLSSALVEEFTEAMVDEPGEAREWLLRMSPLLSVSRMKDPEAESLRPLDADEMFSSRRGLAWMHEGKLIWLGEIGGELFSDRHGCVIQDVHEEMREHVVALIVERVVARFGADEVFVEVVQAVHDAIDENDPMRLWFHDLERIVGRVIERAALH